MNEFSKTNFFCRYFGSMHCESTHVPYQVAINNSGLRPVWLRGYLLADLRNWCLSLINSEESSSVQCNNHCRRLIRKMCEMAALKIESGSSNLQASQLFITSQQSRPGLNDQGEIYALFSWTFCKCLKFSYCPVPDQKRKMHPAPSTRPVTITSMLQLVG